MNILPALCLSLLASGCAATVAPDPKGAPGLSLHKTVWTDPSSIPAGSVLESLVRNSAAAWVVAAPELVLDVQSGACPANDDDVICIHAGTDQEEMAAIAANHVYEGSVGGLTMGLPGRESSTITLFVLTWGSDPSTAIGSDYSVAATRHELGHALGLVHTGPGTLMCVLYQEGTSEITPADVAQFWSLHQR